MDQKPLLLCEEKEQNGKLPKQQLDEGKQVTEEELQQGKERSISHVAMQTEHEQTKVRKAPCVVVQVQQQLEMRDNASCVTVTVQQQWNRGEKVPEVIVRVQQQGQMTEVPCVTVKVDQEWEVPCVTVKVQQQKAEREVPCPCITVQLQYESPEEDVPYGNADWQQTRTYEAAPCRTQEDQQQAKYKEGGVAAEMESWPQTQKRAKGRDSEPLEREAKDSLVEKSLPQQHRGDRDVELLNLVQLAQSDPKENKLEDKTVITENPLHAVSHDGKRTNLYQWSMTEEDKRTTTEQHKEDGNTFNQQQLSSDEGAPKALPAEEQEQEGRQEEETVSTKHKREAPNYFVAIPITNDQILDKIEDVQELIFNKEPDLLKALIPVQTMHLTIIVAHLRTEDDVKRKPTARNASPIEGLQCNGAVSALEHSKAKVEALLQGKCFSMTFHGIGQFNNQVIYVKMSEDEQQMLRKIAEAVESSFIEMNIDITGSKDFKPHLTFLKLSKAPALRRKGFRKIQEDLYTEYEDSPFGTELFSKIDLCAMHKKKQDSGYYHCECSINVYPTNSQDNKNDTLQTDLEETIPLNDGTHDHTSTTPVSSDLSSQSNLKLTEHLDGGSATTSSDKNGTNEQEAEARAEGETFSADGQVCSKLLPELLPANPKALKAKDEEQEKTKLTDGDLGKVEAREKASAASY